MIVLYVLAGILILLWLLSLLRFGGWAEYGQNGFLVKIKVGPFLVQVYPRKSKGTSNEKKPKESKTSVGGSVEQLRELLPVVLDAVGDLRRKVRIDKLQMDLVWSDPNPARCAIGFGAANALIGMIWPPIEQNFNVKDYRLHTDVDFNGEKPTIYILAQITLTVGQAISLLLRQGNRVYDAYRRGKPGMDAETKQETTREKEAV
jgi:hypothetical protein